MYHETIVSTGLRGAKGLKHFHPRCDHRRIVRPFHRPSVTRRAPTVASSVSERYEAEEGEEFPRHRGDELPEADLPGSPTRLLSDAFIIANCVIFGLQLWQPSITMAGVQDNDMVRLSTRRCTAMLIYIYSFEMVSS
jgi:hypothetical protein